MFPLGFQFKEVLVTIHVLLEYSRAGSIVTEKPLNRELITDD